MRLHRVLPVALCVLSGVAASQERVVNAAPSGATISGPGAELAAGSDGSAVSIKLSYARSSIPDRSRKENYATFTTYSLTAGAPLGDGQKVRDLLSVDGLGDGTNIGISASTFFARWRQPSTDDMSAARALCQKIQSESADAAWEEAKDAAKFEGKPEPKRPEPSGFACGTANPIAIPYLKQLRALHGGVQPGGWLLGGSAKYGAQDSKFYDIGNLTEIEQRNHPWSVGVHAAWVPALENGAAPYMLTLKLNRKRTFKDKDASVQCPVTATPTLTCLTGSFGPPQAKSSTMLAMEARAVLSTSIGIAATVTRDLTQDITAVEIPVYMLTDGESALTGGVKLTWNTKDKKTGLLLFVGVPFKLWQ